MYLHEENCYSSFGTYTSEGFSGPKIGLVDGFDEVMYVVRYLEVVTLLVIVSGVCRDTRKDLFRRTLLSFLRPKSHFLGLNF